MAAIIGSKGNEDKDMSANELINCVGLEAFLSQGLARHMQEKRTKHLYLVLAEYCYQQELGVSDDDHLARVLETNLEWARKRANNVGVGYWEILEC